MKDPTTFQKASCPLCNGHAITLHVPDYNQSVISDGRVIPYALKKSSCLNCGAAFHNSIVSDGDVRGIYDSEYLLAGTAPKSDVARAFAYAQWIQSECRPVPRSIFEVGCGSGALLREFSTNWPEAVCLGIDPALPSPDRCCSKLRLERGFVEDIPDGTGTFDLIVAVNVIEHTLSPGAFLARLQSRLSPTGIMIIVCPSTEPANTELLFFDHLYSLTPDSLRSAALGTPLVARTHSLAPPSIGDFQMVTFDFADHSSELSLRHESFSELGTKRNAYLRAWDRLDDILLERSKLFPRLVAFGGGQTAALLRAYAPRTWSRLELIILDDVTEAWTLGIPIDSYDNAVQGLGTAGVLIAAAPRTQIAITERLRSDGLESIRWDDLITN